MSLGRALLDRGLPLDAQLSYQPGWYRAAERAAPLAVLGLVDPLRVGPAIVGEPGDAAASVGRHCRRAAWRLESMVGRCEFSIRKLLDEHLDSGTPPHQIQTAIIAYLDAQPDAIQTVIYNTGWDDLIRDRVAAWRGRKSPRGRRMRGQ